MRSMTSPVNLGSSANYFFSSPNSAGSCDLLTGVTVTIAITEDLVAAPPPPNPPPKFTQSGFAFQLNASSPKGDPGDLDWIIWQQYIIGVHGTVVGTLNNWTAASLSNGQTINGPDPARVLLAPPSPNMIPAGTTLKITLQNDADGNVTGVTFDALGEPAQSIALSALTTTGGEQVGTTFVAPIVAFTLDLVGPGDGKYAAFTSGAGTITYSARTPLTPSLQLPSCVANRATTGEISNSTYGTVPMVPSSSVTQSLGPIGTIHETMGHITFLRAHEVGSFYGTPPNFLDCEVIVRLAEDPLSAFGFQLRADSDAPTRTEMFDLLRSSFVGERPVRLDYIKTGPQVGEIIRVANP
jgi:hypothetical protein